MLVFSLSCKDVKGKGKDNQDEPDNSETELPKKGDATIKIFRGAPILFEPKDVPDGYHDPDENGIIRLANGRLILKKLEGLPSYERDVKLTLKARLVSTGDDFDRSGSIFILNKKKKGVSPIDVAKGENYPEMQGELNRYKGIIALDDYEPCVELMRFMTPFGVGYYSELPQLKPPAHVSAWEKDVKWQADISHLYPLLEGEAYIGVWIDTWTPAAAPNQYPKGGGWALDLTLKAEESNEDKARVEWKVAPLINTVPYIGQNYPDVFGYLKQGVPVKPNISRAKEAKLYYTTTGHGGYHGGDEFTKRENTIYLNKNKIKSWIPWKDNCRMVRKWNPASAVFQNGVASSDLDRSNWCPSDMVPPEVIPLDVEELDSDSIFKFIVKNANKSQNGKTDFWLVSAYVVYR